KHNSQRYLKYNPSTAFPIISVLRSNKYRDKGYNISRPEMIRIAFSCQKLEINSWEDFRKHVGGMYGYMLEDMFDETKEFSLDEGLEQLGNLESQDIKEYKETDFNLDEFILDLHKGFEPEELPEAVFHPDKWY